MGNILKLIRIALDLSVKQVSNMTGLSSTYICDVESNRKKISYDMLMNFSSWYNIPSSKIMLLYEEQENGLARNNLLLEILQYYISLNEDKSLIK